MARRGALGQQRGGLVDPLRIDVGEPDEPAPAREMPRRRPADARPAAGDENRLSCHPPAPYTDVSAKRCEAGPKVKRQARGWQTAAARDCNAALSPCPRCPPAVSPPPQD